MKKYIILLLALITLSVSSFGQSSSSNGSQQKGATSGSQQNTGVKHDKRHIDSLVVALQDSFNLLKKDYESTKSAQQTSLDNCVFCKIGTAAYIGLCIAMVIIAILVYFLLKQLTQKSPGEIEKQFRENHQKAHRKEGCDLNKLCTLINIEQKVDAKIERYIRHLKEQIEELRHQINSPQQVICMVTNQPETDNNTSTMPNERPNDEMVSPKVEKKEPNRFFLSFPTQAGDFEDERHYTNEDCLYEFELYPHNDREARFRFSTNSERDMTQALNNLNERIEKVCDATDRPAGRFTKCIPVEDGEARLENGRWIVTKKHQVRYE